jgi:hypothetical protein
LLFFLIIPYNPTSLLKKIVAEQNDIYLREIQEKLQQVKGIDVSISGINRTLTRLELGRKKKH